jgi:hypothetical protein
MPPSCTTTWSPTASTRSPDKGIEVGNCARRRRSERRMRVVGTFACTSPCAVRITTRSWNEKRYSRRGPRAGDTKPASIRPRTIERGNPSRRATSCSE